MKKYIQYNPSHYRETQPDVGANLPHKEAPDTPQNDDRGPMVLDLSGRSAISSVAKVTSQKWSNEQEAALDLSSYTRDESQEEALDLTKPSTTRPDHPRSQSYQPAHTANQSQCSIHTPPVSRHSRSPTGQPYSLLQAALNSNQPNAGLHPVFDRINQSTVAMIEQRVMGFSSAGMPVSDYGRTIKPFSSMTSRPLGITMPHISHASGAIIQGMLKPIAITTPQPHNSSVNTKSVSDTTFSVTDAYHSITRTNNQGYPVSQSTYSSGFHSHIGQHLNAGKIDNTEMLKHSLNSLKDSNLVERYLLQPPDGLNRLMGNVNLIPAEVLAGFSCEQCSKTFKTKAALKLHMTVHKTAEERQYACTICTRRFLHRHHLVVHLRKHSGEKPFKCNACSKTFMAIFLLHKHLRKHVREMGHVSQISTEQLKQLHDKKVIPVSSQPVPILSSVSEIADNNPVIVLDDDDDVNATVEMTVNDEVGKLDRKRYERNKGQTILDMLENEPNMILERLKADLIKKSAGNRNTDQVKSDNEVKLDLTNDKTPDDVVEVNDNILEVNSEVTETHHSEDDNQFHITTEAVDNTYNYIIKESREDSKANAEEYEMDKENEKDMEVDKHEFVNPFPEYGSDDEVELDCFTGKFTVLRKKGGNEGQVIEDNEMEISNEKENLNEDIIEIVNTNENLCAAKVEMWENNENEKFSEDKIEPCNVVENEKSSEHKIETAKARNTDENEKLSEKGMGTGKVVENEKWSEHKIETGDHEEHEKLIESKMETNENELDNTHKEKDHESLVNDGTKEVTVDGKDNLKEIKHNCENGIENSRMTQILAEKDFGMKEDTDAKFESEMLQNDGTKSEKSDIIDEPNNDNTHESIRSKDEIYLQISNKRKSEHEIGNIFEKLSEMKGEMADTEHVKIEEIMVQAEADDVDKDVEAILRILMQKLCENDKGAHCEAKKPKLDENSIKNKTDTCLRTENKTDCSDIPELVQCVSGSSSHRKGKKKGKKVKCEVCSRSFHSNHYLILHMAVHKRNPMLQSLKKAKDYQMKAMGFLNKTNVTCEICKKVFKFQKSLNSHMRVHSEKMIQTKLYRKAFRDFMAEAVPHSGRSNGKENSRTKRIESESRWRRLSAGDRRVEWEPDAASASVKRISYDSEAILKDEHYDNPPIKIIIGEYNVKRYLCHACDNTYTTKQKLRMHALIHKDNCFLCDICGKSFFRHITLEKHISTHMLPRPHICDVCKKSFIHRSSLMRHRVIHEKPVMPSIKQQVADINFEMKMLDTYTMLRHERMQKLHMQKAHDSLKTEPVPVKVTEKYVNPLDLSVRIKNEDHGLPPVLSPVSIPTATHASDWNLSPPLITHETVSEHNDRPMEKTDFIRINEREDNTRDSDLVRSVDVIDIHRCRTESTCSESEITVEGHQIVKKRSRKTRVYQTSCRMCKEVFPNVMMLKSHMVVHNSVETHLYECHICRHRFTQSCSLLRHLKTSCQENRMKCVPCGRTFHRRNTFEQHMRLHMGGPVNLDGSFYDKRHDEAEMVEERESDIENNNLSKIEEECANQEVIAPLRLELINLMDKDTIDNGVINDDANNTDSDARTYLYSEGEVHSRYNSDFSDNDWSPPQSPRKITAPQDLSITSGNMTLNLLSAVCSDIRNAEKEQELKRKALEEKQKEIETIEILANLKRGAMQNSMQSSSAVTNTNHIESPTFHPKTITTGQVETLCALDLGNSRFKSNFQGQNIYPDCLNDRNKHNLSHSVDSTDSGQKMLTAMAHCEPQPSTSFSMHHSHTIPSVIEGTSSSTCEPKIPTVVLEVTAEAERQRQQRVERTWQGRSFSMLAEISPHLTVSNHHSSRNSPHSAVSSHYPLTNSPHSVVSSLQPSTNSPHSVISSHHPLTNSPHSVIESHHPLTNSPHSVIDSHHPLTNSPHSVVNSHHPLANSPHSVISSHQPLANSPHSVISSHHPLTNSPHLTVSSHHPLTNSPLSVISSLHPSINIPYSVISSHHPLKNSPHSVVSSPHPLTNSPHLTVSSPHPLTNSPYSAVSSPHPLTNSPYSAVSSHHPLTNSPHSVINSHHPLTSIPHSVVSSLQPSTTSPHSAKSNHQMYAYNSHSIASSLQSAASNPGSVVGNAHMARETNLHQEMSQMKVHYPAIQERLSLLMKAQISTPVSGISQSAHCKNTTVNNSVAHTALNRPASSQGAYPMKSNQINDEDSPEDLTMKKNTQEKQSADIAPITTRLSSEIIWPLQLENLKRSEPVHTSPPEMPHPLLLGKKSSESLRVLPIETLRPVLMDNKTLEISRTESSMSLLSEISRSLPDELVVKSENAPVSHPLLPVFQCDLCTRVLYNKTDLHLHMMEHGRSAGALYKMLHSNQSLEQKPPLPESPVGFSRASVSNGIRAPPRPHCKVKPPLSLDLSFNNTENLMKALNQSASKTPEHSPETQPKYLVTSASKKVAELLSPISSSDQSDSLSSPSTPSGSGPSAANQDALRHELRLKIYARRRSQGLDDLKVEFKSPEPTEMTESEKLKLLYRRECNRQAAQRSRMRKKDLVDSLLEKLSEMPNINQKEKKADP